MASYEQRFRVVPKHLDLECARRVDDRADIENDPRNRAVQAPGFRIRTFRHHFRFRMRCHV